jgi:hypothetical protein
MKSNEAVAFNAKSARRHKTEAEMVRAVYSAIESDLTTRNVGRFSWPTLSRAQGN